VSVPSAFALSLPHGHCTGLVIAADVDLAAVAQELHEDERAIAETLAPRRRRTWVLGRIALRRSLVAIGIEAGAIGSTARGAPALPPGVTGSISHKEDFVVALAAPDALGPIGVDVEWDRPPRHDVRRHVLRGDEGVDLEAPWPAAASETMLRFSVKEAIYKALDRHVGRYVGFHEVAVVPEADATARVALHLRDAEGPFSVEVHWERRDGLLLTSARVARVGPGEPAAPGGPATARAR
jgi:4'-phosphopantetheinyl transferase EntD